MTSLIPHVLYKYKASASQKLSSIHSTSYCSQTETSYRLRNLAPIQVSTLTHSAIL